MQAEQERINQMTDEKRWEYFKKKNNPYNRIYTVEQLKMHNKYLEQKEEKYKNMYLD